MRLNRTQHRGITILEVIIAMGISIFGLLAVMSIVPFAARRARTGLEIEEGAQLAQRAIGDFHAYNMADPNNWVVWSPIAVPAPFNLAPGDNFYVDLPSFNEPQNFPSPPPPDFNDPNIRWFSDEAVLIDPQFYAVHPEVTQFPYCYESIVGSPPPFVDPENGQTAPYRDPLFDGAQLNPPGFTHFDSKAPGVRRVSLANGLRTGRMPLVMAREIFETADDLDIRPLNPIEESAVPEFSFKRSQYYEGADPVSGNQVFTKPLSQGRTSWLAMMVPQDSTRTVWQLFIIVVRDRDPSFDMDLINERVGRIRGTTNYPTLADGLGFLSADGSGVSRRGGLVRVEAWGTTNLLQVAGQPAVGSPAWQTMEKDLKITPGQWVCLAQWGPGGARRYQWYRVQDAAVNTEPSLVDNVAFDDGGLQDLFVPGRTMTLVGPDWDARFDTLVYTMDNVIAVYERTIRIPANSFPQPQTHPWDAP